MTRFFLKFAYQVLRLILMITRPMTVGVRIMLIRDGQVLLVKHSYQPDWFFPGGFMEQGETPLQAARREASEEVGATLGAARLFGIYTAVWSGHTNHTIVFTCAEFTLTSTASAEIQAQTLSRLDDLPADIDPGCRRRIQEYLGRPTQPFVDIW